MGNEIKATPAKKSSFSNIFAPRKENIFEEILTARANTLKSASSNIRPGTLKNSTPLKKNGGGGGLPLLMLLPSIIASGPEKPYYELLDEYKGRVDAALSDKENLQRYPALIAIGEKHQMKVEANRKYLKLLDDAALEDAGDGDSIKNVYIKANTICAIGGAACPENSVEEETRRIAASFYDKTKSSWLYFLIGQSVVISNRSGPLDVYSDEDEIYFQTANAIRERTGLDLNGTSWHMPPFNHTL